MSWQQWVDEQLMYDINGKGDTLVGGAILGLDGGVWAQSPNFPTFTVDQVEAIVDGFRDRTPKDQPFGSFKLGDTKYLVTAGDPGVVIRGKSAGGGICIKRTAQALVVGIWAEPVNAGQCNTAVETLGDKLAETGY